METFNWCFIGAGGIANTVAEQITKSKRHRIVSVWNRTKSKAEEFSLKFQSAVYDSAEEAILDPRVDGVYINTSHSKHKEYSMLALNLNKPVLCEKAFTLNYHEAKEVFEFAQKQNTYIAEAMWTWYAPIAYQVKAIIENAILGKIRNVKGVFSVPILKGENVSTRYLDNSQGGGALLDLGVYPVAYTYRLFGIPNKIDVTGIVEQGVDITEKILFHYDGFTCELHSSMLDDQGIFYDILGETGELHIPNFFMAKEYQLNEVLHCLPDAKVNKFNHSSLYIYQFDHVAEEIKRGLKESTYVTQKATLDVMKLMDEIRKQLGVVYAVDEKSIT